jgi:hypothetical protein
LESIWRSKKLRFSPAKNTNDFFERFKTFVLTQDTFMCDGYPLDRDQFDNFDEKIREELNNYKQVSFSYDYNNGMKGYASPMMWGQYAWRKNKVGSWQNGVCLAIDSEKIKEPAFKIYSNKIFYNSVIDTPRVENIDYTKEGAAALFVARNIHAYFFTKHKHWEHENEYRYINKINGKFMMDKPPSCLYLGSCIEKEEEKKLLHIAKIKKIPQVQKIVTIAGKYELSSEIIYEQ